MPVGVCVYNLFNILWYNCLVSHALCLQVFVFITCLTWLLLVMMMTVTDNVFITMNPLTNSLYELCQQSRIYSRVVFIAESYLQQSRIYNRVIFLAESYLQQSHVYNLFNILWYNCLVNHALCQLLNSSFGQVRQYKLRLLLHILTKVGRH